MSALMPGPDVALIEQAAKIIVASKKQPHTAPYHWAGALWEAGMLVAPPTAPLADEEHVHRYAAFNGYCVECGADGWDKATRRDWSREQAGIHR